MLLPRPEDLSKLTLSEQQELLKLLETYDDIQTKDKASKDFLEFVKVVWPGFIHGNHHRIMADAFNKVAEGKTKRLIINLPPRHPYAITTPVATTKGWKTIGSIESGDYVFDRHGRPTKVVGKSPVYVGRNCYRVVTDDGAAVVCDAQHTWAVNPLGQKGITDRLKTYTTEALYRRQICRKPDNQRSARLPIWEAVQYPEAALPIHPYVLGLWLGDGTAKQAIITKMTFGVLGLKVKLRALGVLGNKHIPDMYMTASHDQRMELLRGLMDTDGNVSKDGQCFFATKHADFRDQVIRLINSLGCKASFCAQEAKIGSVSYGIHYKVSFYMKDCAYLPRKADRTYNPKKLWRYITEIVPVESVPTQCIEVESEDHLFLVGDRYIVGTNTKSELASVHFPAYYLGRFPDRKIIQCSHTAELAVGFGRKVRDLVATPNFQKVFPEVTLRADSKAAGRWATSQGADYFAIGVGGAVTGKGADVLILDDVHSEQEAALAESNPGIYDKVFDWYTSGPRQRLQPGGAIVVVMTRWSLRDLTARLIGAQSKDGSDQWDVIELPAILPSGKALWPEFWPLSELATLKAELPITKWNAQYMQDPTASEGSLIKREWWQVWEEDDPPKCEAIISSWDTAFTKSERADYTACTTWGVFKRDDSTTGKQVTALILLDAWREKLSFPELKQQALDHYKEWEPDSMVVEGRAAGKPLIYELRSMGIPVQEFNPVRGNDKISRVNAVTDIFASGNVWAPDTRWAEEVREECASFPAGAHDDYVDTVSQALLRFRQGGWIHTGLDEAEEPAKKRKLRRAFY